MPLLVFGGPKHDVWISAILATITGITGCYLLIVLSFKYPSQTIIQYSQQILGTWLGKILGVVYICFFILIACYAARDFSELLLNYIMPWVPIHIFVGILVITSAYALLNGLTAVGRIAEIMVPFIFLVIFIGIIGNLPNAYFLPSLPINNSVKTIFTEAMMELPFFGMAVSWFFLIPLLNEKTGAKKSLLLATALVCVARVLIACIVVAVVGPYMSTSINYPFYFIFHQIKLINAIPRLDPLFVVAWISSSLLTVSLFYYIAISSIKQCLGIRNYRLLLLGVGIVIFCVSIYAFPTFQDFKQSLRLDNFGLISIPLFLGIPLFLLVVSYIKDLYNQQAGGKLHG